MGKYCYFVHFPKESGFEYVYIYIYIRIYIDTLLKCLAVSYYAAVSKHFFES